MLIMLIIIIIILIKIIIIIALLIKLKKIIVKILIIKLINIIKLLYKNYYFSLQQKKKVGHNNRTAYFFIELKWSNGNQSVERPCKLKRTLN